MRRAAVTVLLAALLTGLLGCAAQKQEQYRNPIRFYYCDLTQEHAHGGTDGVLAYETVDLVRSDLTVEEVLDRYFEGPRSETLTAPFEPETRCESAALDGGVLSIRLNEKYAALSGMWLTLTNVCLYKTLAQLPYVEQVRIENESLFASQGGAVFSESDFLTEDTSMLLPKQTLTLYVPDAESGRLAAVQTQVSPAPEEPLAEAALEELFEQDAFPSGITCTGLRVQGGLCLAVLSERFLQCNSDAQTAELAVHAVAATLCALDGIDRVRLSVDGGEMTQFLLDEELSPESGWFLES